MRIGYLECFAGISGDMLLGAAVDAGVSADLLQQTAQSLNIGSKLRLEYVDRSGIRSTKVHVEVNGLPAESVSPYQRVDKAHNHRHEHSHDHHHEDQHSQGDGHDHAHSHGRSWKQIRELITGAVLPNNAKHLALRAFELLAQAEGKVHGVAVEDVHFHEVGNVDTIT
ncbi:MAG: DUF111 family protein, partial [Acidobacteriaceae bacterium]|nr:DUF111 family protein [Acidobacteriaceae bacterium]